MDPTKVILDEEARKKFTHAKKKPKKPISEIAQQASRKTLKASKEFKNSG